MSAWDRRDGESVKAYRAFIAYRDLGAERSLSKVAQQLSKSETIIKRWSSQFDWVARAQAWDDEQQTVADETMLDIFGDNLAKERKELLQAELDDYRTALAEYRRAMAHARVINREHTGVTKDPATGETIKIVTVRLTPNEHIRLMRWRLDIARLGRLALGLPMTVRESRLADENGEALPLTALLDEEEDDDTG